MKTAIVNLSELGGNCWSSLRFVDLCYRCYKYDVCKYSERVANEEYDCVVKEMLVVQEELKRLTLVLKKMRGEVE